MAGLGSMHQLHRRGRHRDTKVVSHFGLCSVRHRPLGGRASRPPSRRKARRAAKARRALAACAGRTRLTARMEGGTPSLPIPLWRVVPAGKSTQSPVANGHAPRQRHKNRCLSATLPAPAQAALSPCRHSASLRRPKSDRLPGKFKVRHYRHEIAAGSMQPNAVAMHRVTPVKSRSDMAFSTEAIQAARSDTLIQRFQSRPRDFTWPELIRLAWKYAPNDGGMPVLPYASAVGDASPAEGSWAIWARPRRSPASQAVRGALRSPARRASHPPQATPNHSGRRSREAVDDYLDLCKEHYRVSVLRPFPA